MGVDYGTENYCYDDSVPWGEDNEFRAPGHSSFVETESPPFDSDWDTEPNEGEPFGFDTSTTTNTFHENNYFQESDEDWSGQNGMEEHSNAVPVGTEFGSPLSSRDGSDSGAPGSPTLHRNSPQQYQGADFGTSASRVSQASTPLTGSNSQVHQTPLWEESSEADWEQTCSSTFETPPLVVPGEIESTDSTPLQSSFHPDLGSEFDDSTDCFSESAAYANSLGGGHQWESDQPETIRYFHGAQEVDPHSGLPLYRSC